MKIGIDIDGVLTNIEQFCLDYVTRYCYLNNISYVIGPSDYESYKTFGITEAQDDAFWEEYIEYYATNEKARPFASEVIQKLKEEGNEIIIITARWLSNREDAIGEHMRNLVKTWLEKNAIPYDKLVFSKGVNEEKSTEIKENLIDVMIEDNPCNIEDLSKIIPVICYHTSYNQKCFKDNVYRAYSWYDIYKIIQELKQNNY